MKVPEHKRPASTEMLEHEEGNPDYHLIFSLGPEYYAATLGSIREVIKWETVKPVPYMVPHFMGVINLRGQLVSVVDLRSKFAITPAAGSPGLILVTERGESLIGALVDDVHAVSRFSPSEIATTMALQTKVPIKFFCGIAKHGDHLVNVIDVAGSLSEEEFSTVKRSQESI